MGNSLIIIYPFYYFITMVKYIKTLDEFNDLIEKSKSKLVLIDFTATWCGPCQRIAPEFENYSTANPNVICVKVDVDESPDITQKCEISCMPTFQLYKDGKKVDSVSGADMEGVKRIVVNNQ